MSQDNSATDFIVRVAARFLKDPAISSDAKALRAVLGAYADGHTGTTYVMNPGGLSGRNCECYFRRRSAKRDPATPEQALPANPAGADL